jgi:predicted Rdx family selenoprotein
VRLRKAAAEKGIKVKVRSGSPGQFEISKDGAVVYDYQKTRQLPGTEELLKLISP